MFGYFAAVSICTSLSLSLTLWLYTHIIIYQEDWRGTRLEYSKACSQYRKKLRNRRSAAPLELLRMAEFSPVNLSVNLTTNISTPLALQFYKSPTSTEAVNSAYCDVPGPCAVKAQSCRLYTGAVHPPLLATQLLIVMSAIAGWIWVSSTPAGWRPEVDMARPEITLHVAEPWPVARHATKCLLNFCARKYAVGLVWRETLMSCERPLTLMLTYCTLPTIWTCNCTRLWRCATNNHLHASARCDATLRMDSGRLGCANGRLHLHATAMLCCQGHVSHA